MKCQQKSWTGFIVDLVWLNLPRSKSQDNYFPEYSFNSSRNATGVRIKILLRIKILDIQFLSVI